jgi:membrane associated rhomboid family serine protease
MRRLWQRFVAALTPGVRVLLSLQVACFLLAQAGQLSRTLDLHYWLALGASAVWHGQIWRLVTYALLPAGIMDFAMTALALVMLGPLLERHWTRRELWLFCGIAAGGAGLVDLLLAGAGSPTLAGAAPVMFGLMIAWTFTSGHEVVPGLLFGPLTVRQLVWLLAAVSLCATLFSAGFIATLVLAASGLAGGLYLWLSHKWLQARACRAVDSERIRRLEL